MDNLVSDLLIRIAIMGGMSFGVSSILHGIKQYKNDDILKSSVEMGSGVYIVVAMSVLIVKLLLF